MAKKKIFISYDFDNDKKYKNLLLAWDANSEFDFSFYDASVDVSVNSTDAATIRRVISARINDASYFLCIVGKETHYSECIDWEIEKASELNKMLVGVKIKKEYNTPTPLLGTGTSWALSFTFTSIKNAIENA